MLTLPEELLLLALDDRTGTDNLHAYLDRALIAAALLDLVLQGRIRFHKPGVFRGEGLLRPQKTTDFWQVGNTYSLVVPRKVTGSSYIDYVLTTIATHYYGYFLHSFSTLALVYLDRTNFLSPTVYGVPPNQRLLAAQDLLAGEQLIEQTTRFLFVRNTTLPQGNRSTGEPELRERLQRGLQDNFASADERMRALLLLIYSTGLVESIWGPANRDAAEWRIAQVLRLTMESQSILADAHRYIVNGIGEEDLAPLQVLAPIPV